VRFIVARIKTDLEATRRSVRDAGPLLEKMGVYSGSQLHAQGECPDAIASLALHGRRAKKKAGLPQKPGPDLSDAIL
jgi:hypothetical protein